jgi:hypothetical protein
LVLCPGKDWEGEGREFEEVEKRKIEERANRRNNVMNLNQFTGTFFIVVSAGRYHSHSHLSYINEIRM